MWSLICGLAVVKEVVGGQLECPAKCTEDQGKMTSRGENGRDERVCCGSSWGLNT